MNKLIRKIELMRKAGRYDDIVDVINADDYYSHCPFGLTVKGRCIQLCTRTGIRLSEAEKCFKKAITLDPNCVEAMIELAWFYHAIKDNPAQARVWFNEAFQIVRSQMNEIRKGLRDVNEDYVNKKKLPLKRFVKKRHRERVVSVSGRA